MTTGVSRRTKGWIYHLRYDPVLMILAQSVFSAQHHSIRWMHQLGLALLTESFHRAPLLTVNEARITQWHIVDMIRRSLKALETSG